MAVLGPNEGENINLADQSCQASGGTMHQTLRKMGNSLVMKVPVPFIKKNRLTAGSQVQVTILGNKLILEVARPCYRLEDLMAEMPDGFPRAEYWDELPSVGFEKTED